MDKNKRKELAMAYKNRKPDMGIISYRCKETGEVFLGTSTDTRSDFNSINVKLSSGFYPNKRLLELWQEHGKDGFEITVAKELKYDNPADDQTEKLEAMREAMLEVDPKARKIWK